jgi:hypothetical protein
MTTRSTTLVESDQLAQAAVNIIRNEALVPKGKRWPFSRTSRAHRDYDKAVQEITARRREAREKAVEQKINRERTNADGALERATQAAQSVRDEKIAQAKKPFDEVEVAARSTRDAAIAAAKQAYELAVEEADRAYRQETVGIEEARDEAVAQARATHSDACAALQEQKNAELAQITRDLRTIPLEGPMRVVEDREAWPVDERKKALIGLIDMAGREDFESDLVELCLQNVLGYVYQDRYLPQPAQHQRLMDANLLEALVDLARRSAEKRPTIVKYMADIVAQNQGHTSPAFIRTLTELYVIASADTKTLYHPDLVENEQIVELMRGHIAETLKLTPRRSQIPPAAPAAASGAARERTHTPTDETKPPGIPPLPLSADITADVEVGELIPVEVPPPLRKRKAQTPDRTR